jgi:CspA family cold shock protein
VIYKSGINNDEKLSCYYPEESICTTVYSGEFFSQESQERLDAYEAMAESALAMNTESTSLAGTNGRSRRISQAEWPQIVARYENGDPVAAIARDYGVTGPAIRYILKKVQGDPAKPVDEAREPEAHDQYVSPLAQRLAEASKECCQAIDELHTQAGDFGRVNAVVHQVRRALAAIEIELSRQEHASPLRTAGYQGEPRRVAPVNIARPAGENSQAVPEGALEGTVKFFNHDKGFGFVTLDDTSQDVFVHIRAVERSGLVTLQPEQRVRLTTTMGQKGPQAETVTLI